MSTAEYVVGDNYVYSHPIKAGPATYGASALRRTGSLIDVLDGVRSDAGRVVLWIHESAHRSWGLPGTIDEVAAEIGAPADAISGDGWIRLGRDRHLAFPLLSGVFADLETPQMLAAAIAVWRELVGDAFLYSAPSCALFMVDDRRLARPEPLPEAVAASWLPSAYSVPAHAWHRALGPSEAARPFAQLVDRRGSYLAAWRGAELPDGPWRRERVPEDGIGAWPGYYLIDTSPLRALIESERLPDPFERAGDDESVGPGRWLTAPLATLARDLAHEAGVGLVRHVHDVVLAQTRVRALDRAGEVLANARAACEADRTSPVAAAVLAQVKDAYTRATAHLEYGKRPGHMLHRPAWRHHIVDRHVANTWRSLRQCRERPIAFGGVDSALFAVAPHEWPLGLPDEAGRLGTWKRRGEAVPMSTVMSAFASERGARGLVRDLITEGV